MGKTSEIRGEETYQRLLQQNQAWRERNPEKAKGIRRTWYKNHTKRAQITDRERHRKDGKYYEQTREYDRTTLRHARNLIRGKHQFHYRPFKKIIAPDSQLHHEWLLGTADFTGVALVEKNQHQHGYIDIIQVLEGEITLLSEIEIAGGKL